MILEVEQPMRRGLDKLEAFVIERSIRLVERTAKKRAVGSGT